ncbi:hypothetical protein C1645_831612 [Glomus cerebriforme]|uniref:Uncharacterized protein n=1 Tax=Glomus cerebriforme TaxID=658196 RepID=A0A397SPW9_9GLOM|nr:hypothetical protein C1645_831612 [Glomus cerebriforme]
MIGKWLITIEISDKKETQDLILSTIISSILHILKNVDSTNSLSISALNTNLNIPSLFHLKIIFQLKKIYIDPITLEELGELDEQYCKNLGKAFANKFCKFKKEFNIFHKILQNLPSLNDYIFFDNIIDKCFTFYSNLNGKLQYMTNFNASTIHNRILEKLDHGCFGNPSHIIILKAEGIPNSNESIYQLAEMYKKDFSLNSNEYLDIVADRDAICNPQIWIIHSSIRIKQIDGF